MPSLSITPRDVARELARRYSTMTHDELDLLESILVAKKYAKNEKILDEAKSARISIGLSRDSYDNTITRTERNLPSIWLPRTPSVCVSRVFSVSSPRVCK